MTVQNPSDPDDKPARGVPVMFTYLEVGFFHSWLLLQHTNKHLTWYLLLAHGFHHLTQRTVAMNRRHNI